MEIFTNLFAHAVAFSALAVVLIHQVLKFKFIPANFANKYPVPTVIVLSAIASIVVVLRTPVKPVTWIDWAILIGTITVTAALTYNVTIKNWAELRATEG